MQFWFVFVDSKTVSVTFSITALKLLFNQL